MKKMWDDITAEMMTEEETGSENNYIRRRQSWRSSAFNVLMDKLDEDRSSKSLARPRDLGESVLRSPPPSAKPWMVMVPTTTSQDAEGSANGLPPQNESDHETQFSDGEESTITDL
jgi:hypothetical protein